MPGSPAGSTDLEHWNEKYQERLGKEPGAAERFVLAALDQLPKAAAARAADLACGRGRHALELARRGWQVEAWDISTVALGELARRAAGEGLAVATRAVDLSRPAALPQASFDLVVAVNYLERRLHPVLRELVVPGGHLILATFTEDRRGEHPRLEWCLGRGELQRGLPGFRPLLAEEAFGRAGLLARREEKD